MVTNHTTQRYKSYNTRLQIIKHKVTNYKTQGYKSYHTRLQIIQHKVITHTSVCLCNKQRNNTTLAKFITCLTGNEDSTHPIVLE